MIRLIVFAVLLYILSLVVSNVIKWYAAWKMRQGQPRVNPSAKPKSDLEYKNVTDAKFEDIAQPTPKEQQTENHS